jgi:hypothetical protein
LPEFSGFSQSEERKNSAKPKKWPSMIRNVSLVNGQTDRLALPYTGRHQKRKKKASFPHFLLTYCQPYQEQHNANEMSMKMPPGGAEKRNVVVPANNREVP